MEAGRIVQNSVGSGIRALLPLCLLFGSIAPGCHRGNRTESLSPVRVNTVSEPVAVHQQFHNPSAAYLTPGFSEESSSSRRLTSYIEKNPFPDNYRYYVLSWAIDLPDKPKPIELNAKTIYYTLDQLVKDSDT